MQLSHNVLNDYENGLCNFKASMQDKNEEEKAGVFNGAANVIAISGHPRNVRFALDCGVAADFVLYGQYVKARSVEFWIYLASVSGAITIIDPVVGSDVNQTDGTLSYADWDNAYVDGVDTDTITTGWSHIVLTSSTDVTWASGFNIGKGDIRVTGLRFWNHELSATEIDQLMSGAVDDYQHDSILILDFPNLTDLSKNGNDGTNHGADIVMSGRNGENCFDFISGNSDYVDCGDIGTIKSIVFWINPDNVTQSILDCNGGLHKITVAGGTIAATGFAAFYVDGIASGILGAKGWHQIVATDSVAISASQLYLGREGANYMDGKLDIVEAYSGELTLLQVNQVYHKQQRGLL